MTFSEPLPDYAGPHAAAPASGTDTRVLAAALSHLLRRDEERPARWRAGSFAEAVEAARSDLGSVVAIPPLAAPGSGGGPDLDFHEAVERLARNPVDVAVAVRRLELVGRRPLPSWPNLVRHGLPSQPSDLDRALWFG